MELKKGLVSLLVPCYNGKRFIDRCIDSILQQTYTYIELIMVNDGSADNSNELIENRRKELEQRISYFQYINLEENIGVGGVINLALKHFTGEYIALFDIDDYMMPDALERKVRFLEEHPDYVAVINNGYFVEDDSFFESGRVFYPDGWKPETEDIFEALTNGKGVKNYPGTYMIRSEAWLSLCPDREIYPSRDGQNMQMLLPVTYHQKTGYIDIPLMRYLVRPGSLSCFENDINAEKQIRLSERHQDIYHHVVEKICVGEEKERVLRNVNQMFARSRLHFAVRARNRVEAVKAYNELKVIGCRNDEDIIFYYGLIRPWYSLLLRVKRKIVILSKGIMSKRK